MGCCCSEDEDQKQPGMVQQRKCRDVLFLLLFTAFWAGMFVVCGLAFQKGDANRLVYALDSSGMLCGVNNTYRNTSVDLTAKPNLYYLNALDLLSVNTMMYAKSVCVADCPTTADICSASGLPCTNASQYRCPYYIYAENDLYGQLGSIGNADTEYWDDLPQAKLASCNATYLSLAASKLNLTAYGASAGMCSAAGNIPGTYYQVTSQFPGEGPCYPVWVATVPYFNRCFPKFPDELTGAVVQVMNKSAGVLGNAASVARDAWSSQSGTWSSYVADISKAILMIVIAGLGGGVILSLFWMLVLRFFAGFMAWATILLVNLGLAGCTLYCYNAAGKLATAGQWGAAIASNLPQAMDPTLVSRQNWVYIAYGMTAFTGLIFLFTLIMLRRVAVAVACIKVASQAVSTMPSILFFPLLPFIFEVGLVIYWVAVTAVLYSAGIPTAHWRPSQDYQPLSFQSLLFTNETARPVETAPVNTTGMSQQDVLDVCAKSPDCYISYDWDNQLMYAFIYHFFGLLWTNQFIVGFASVVIAGAVASYYWERGEKSSMPTFPVIRAMRNTVIYHLGSIAIGAFIIAVIQFIRFVLEYLDKKTQQIQKQNKWAEWLMCCVKCCMWCLEKIVMFVNRNAFIMVAVKGTGYCGSAARAVHLIVANAIRLATVNVVGDALLFLGKLAVASGCGLIAFALSNTAYYNDPTAYPSTYLSSAILPIAVSALTGFIVGQIFFSVYEMAIDTILLSFCEDCESNGGHPHFAPPLLMDAIGEKPQAADPYGHHQGGRHH